MLNASASSVPEAALHPAYLRLLQAVLERQGVASAPLLAAAGISAVELESDAAGIDAPRLQRLADDALRVSGRPWLGLELGAAAQVLSHGPLGLAAAASGSLRQALDLIARFLALRAPLLRLRVTEGQGGVALELRVQGLSGEAARFVLEAALVMLEQLLAALCARDFAAARIELPWPAPPWARHYPSFLRARLSFEARLARLLLPSALADASVLSADPQALAFARAECERRLGEGAPGRELLAALRRRLLRCEGGYPDAAEVAAEFGFSLRSFHRALQQEGTRWRALLDESRRERACALLRDSHLPVEQIALRLGYAEASNFSRCFRRWCGMSPAAWRQRD